MKYFSTHKKSSSVNYKDALIRGLAPDRGLYLPEEILPYPQDLMQSDTYWQMADKLAQNLLNDEIESEALSKIIQDAFNFAVPVKKIHDFNYVLELYHGPTAAFKDFGARFMARCMSYFLEQESMKVTILVATSGDTGSAVAKGFYQVPNIDVVILYPKNKVSPLQEKQLTTLGHNITALEINGTFDDCQHMVKEAFMDQKLNDQIQLSSANSINIGRLLPQSFYYFWAYQQIMPNQSMVFCTPSGNFGNLTGGILAKRMGLNIKQFIAATNVNDVVPEYLTTGQYRPRPSIATFSNAMDVGNPSNFDRMLAIYGSHDEMNQDILGYKVTDSQTLAIISSVYQNYNYLLDPHGAVGYKALSDYRKERGDEETPIVLLETAHPAKFGEVIEKATGVLPEIPEVLKEALTKEKVSIEINAKYEDLKNYLLNR
ncbi:MAG: threonine synthase [Spirochaetes bacterium]|nr:threonine synthase [Spirochaetota bacterium]